MELTGNSTLSSGYALAAGVPPGVPANILWDVGAKVSMKLWGLCALAATDMGHKKNGANGDIGADALLTLGYRWFSAGGYFASKASNVFKDVFLNIAMREHDCAAYIKLETKGSDPDTSFLEGLDLGVDVRTYMPVHWKALARARPPAPANNAILWEGERLTGGPTRGIPALCVPRRGRAHPSALKCQVRP